jgi:Fe2+ transport system protein FeoA
MRIILNKLGFRPRRAGTLMLATLDHPAPRTLRSNEEPIEIAPLSSLRPSTTCRVVQVNAHSDDLRRLQALGVCVGRRVELVKSGDPMIISVVGARVGLSARLAAEVLVTPVDACAPNLAPLASAS